MKRKLRLSAKGFHKKRHGESTAATVSTNGSFVLPFAEQTLRDFHMPGIAGLTGLSRQNYSISFLANILNRGHFLGRSLPQT